MLVHKEGLSEHGGQMNDEGLSVASPYPVSPPLLGSINSSPSTDSNEDEDANHPGSKIIPPIFYQGVGRDKNSSDYDLSNNIQTSQNVFERRILAASPPLTPIIHNTCFQQPLTPESDLTESFDLDMSVTCNPEDFSAAWKCLPEGTRISCTTEKTPLMTECHDHFESHRFFVIASGVVSDGTIKLFLVAQSEGKRCLGEVTFDPIGRELYMHIKAENAGMIPSFVQRLYLWLLFGDFD